MYENLNESNFILFASKAYDKPNAVTSEFEEDLNRIQYIKRLLTKYYSTKILKERLILNHLIIFYNVFGVESSTRMLFFKLEKKDIEVLKPFLILLNFLPDIVRGIDGKDIVTSTIKLDRGAVECLRQLK